jgi:hypothetical protein
MKNQQIAQQTLPVILMQQMPMIMDSTIVTCFLYDFFKIKEKVSCLF